MSPYKVRQLNVDGEVIAEEQVEADSYGGVLRRLRTVAEEANRIEVYNQNGERTGKILVDHWRRTVHRCYH